MSIDAPLVATTVFLLGLTTAAALYFALATARKAGSIRLREQAAAGLDSAPSRLSKSSVQWGGPSGRALARWVRRLEGVEWTRKTILKAQRTLILAGFDRADQVAIYLAARILTPVLLIIAALAFGRVYPRWHGAAIVGGAIFGYLLPDYVLGKLAYRRRRLILHELPAILDLLVVTLEAGMGLTEAIRIVGRETERRGQVLGKELTTAAAEMSAGVSLEDSLQGVAERTGADDVKAVAAVLIQSKEIGGRMGPALRAAAELLTTKRRLRAEESAQRSSIKMLVPLVLLILPAMMIIILGPALIQIFELLMGV
jgi:tight adherence protein C